MSLFEAIIKVLKEMELWKALIAAVGIVGVTGLMIFLIMAVKSRFPKKEV